jgi:HrpA-like RNA helicase
MGLPTLLKKGALRPGMGEKQEYLDTFIAIDYIMDWFGKRIDGSIKATSINDRVIVMESATGSGKSTTFPSELYLRYNKLLRGNIICTQPRVVTTISIPLTIASIGAYKKENRKDNQGIEFGKNIGYATKEYIKKPLERGILFCTIGVLLQYLKNMDREMFLKKYKVIMLDEAHDRSLNLDVIFYYMKKLYDTTPIENCPFLVIASATLDINKYATYFQTSTIFKVTGTSYPITDNYLQYDADNVITTAVDIVSKIHNDNDSDDILISDIVIFIPSQSYVKKLKEKLLELNNTLTKKILPIALDSTVFKESNIDYQNVFTEITKLKLENSDDAPTRKIIIGTNAIETGITIESLKYCIDLGLVNQLEYNPVVNSNVLLIKPVTKAMSQQRRGRVGRIRPGSFFPVYTKKIYDSLLNIQYPEILSNDITIPILNIIIVKYEDIIKEYIDQPLYERLYLNKSKYENIKFLPNIDIYDLELLDNPSNIAINSSLEKLYTLGIIYANGFPTQLGLLTNKIRSLSVENIKMILAGYHYGCNISDLITIACFIQTSKQAIVLSKFKSFSNQFDNNEDFKDINLLKSRLFISCEFIDFLLFFYSLKKEIMSVIDSKTESIEKIKNYCEKNQVNYNGIMTFIENRDEIIRDFLFNMNMNPYSNDHINLYDLLNSYNSNQNLFEESIEEIIKIKQCIYEGYKLNVATYDSEQNVYISNFNGYEIETNSYLLKNFPSLKNGRQFTDNKPKHILYDSLTIKQNFNSDYTFSVSNCITILSGYVNIDFSFI